MTYKEFWRFRFEVDLIENTLQYWQLGIGITRGHFHWNGERIFIWLIFIRHEIRISYIIQESD